MLYFKQPMKGIISSRYGFRIKPKAGWHSGLDIAGKGEVLAAYGGIVVATGDWGNYGNIVNIYHPTCGKIWTLYAHLSKIGVKKGQEVKKGEHIGVSGNTGWSTGDHLHFETRVGRNRMLSAVNPERYLI